MHIGTAIACEICGGSHYLVWPAKSGIDGAAVGRVLEYACPRSGDLARHVLRQRAIILQERPPQAIEGRIVQ